MPARNIMENHIFVSTEILNFYDCDANGVVKLSKLMKMIGMASELDYVNRGMSHAKLAEKGVAFLLSRESVKFNRAMRVGDTITCKTWEHSIEGALFYRYFELCDLTGQVVASANTAWVLVDTNSLKIIKPSSFSAEFMIVPDRTISAEKPLRIKHPADGTACGEKIVYASDMDANGHMNNANYGNVAMDFLDKQLQNREISEFMINFNHQAILDDKLNVYTKTEDGKIIVSAEIDSKKSNCFTASFRFK